MLTVILYNESESSILRKYQFVFLNFQTDNQIALCEWKEGRKKEDILAELDFLTAECHEWKLLVFGGQFTDDVQNVPKQLADVFRAYSGKNKQNSVRSFLPVAVWYVGYCEKHIRVYAGSDRLQRVDEQREFGNAFRMLWFELDASTRMQKEFDLFRLICGMLILAINDIPGNFIECGYFYQLDVIMERDDFAEYVMQLKRQLDQIKELTQVAYQELEGDYRRRSRYPEADDMKESNFTKNRKELDGDIRWESINRNDLNDELSMDNKLGKNRRWIRSRLYFPKGVLKKELGKMHENVDALPGAEFLLNDAAKDRLEREMQEALGGMKVQRKKQALQKQLQKKIEMQEDKLREEKERRQWGREKYLVWLVLSLVQAVLMEPFFYKLILFDGAAVWYQILFVKLAICLGAVAVCYVLLFCFFKIADLWEFGCLKWTYGKLLGKNIEQSQKERIRYMEEIVDLIARYQYAVRLKKDDCNRLCFFELRRKILSRHDCIRENGESICRQLELLLGEDESAVSFSIPEISIDFTVNPKEVEYYWVPHRRSRNMADLNRSGYQINVFFGFISEIILKKTPEEMHENREILENEVK